MKLSTGKNLLDERIRGECLSVDQLIYLSDAIGKLKKLSDEVS